MPENGRGPLDGGVPDLSMMRPVPDASPEGADWAEMKTGLRCAGCGGRIQKGFEFVRLQVLKDPLTGERTALRSTSHACAAPDCDYAIRCAEDATALRKIDNDWLFMDDPRLQAMFATAAGEGGGGGG